MKTDGLSFCFCSGLREAPLGLRATSVYDVAGQLSETIDAMNFRTTFQYDGAGNRTSVEDANGKISQSVYFANRNQVQASVDAMGFRTTYAYDLQGRLQSTQDANGHFVTNVYDSMGRLQFVVNALSENARQYGYDLAGRMVTYADAANRVRTYTYDAAGQNTSIHFPDGKIATYGFDVLGRRTTMSDWGGISTYAFDARGQMSGKTASGYVQAYGYDANGNRTTLTLGGIGVITYVFDDLNRLETAQKPTGELYTMMYDVDSRRTTMQLGNGTTRAYAYDANSRLTTQIELNGATRLVTIVDSYDPVGNRIGRNLDGVLTTWTYDDLYRLTHQDKPGQVCTYVLDPVGNLEVMWEGGANPKSFTFDAADRLVTMALGANLTTFTYTTYGALEVEVTGSQRTTYTYDGQDQLVEVLPHSGVRSTYTFDGDGMRRTAQEGNVSPTTMVWDGSDYLFLDGPSSDQLVLTLDGEIVACGSKDLLTDPLGTLLREISAGASLSSLFSMYPYGSPVLPAFSTPTIPFRYIAAVGYYFDTNDRDYVRARELEKRLGRWMQTDPLWPAEMAFKYGGTSPILIVDPSGARPLLIPGPVRGLAIGCEALRDLSKEAIRDIKACVEKVRKACAANLEGEIGCMAGFCKGESLFIEVGKPDVCCERDPETNDLPCAYAQLQGTWCIVSYCPGNPGCPTFSTKNPIHTILFLHELGHCCGIDHDREKDGDFSCNDIIATCIALNARKR